MDRCEVLIVGGGPAGSTCARRLRQEGIDVLLLDRQTFPRDKTCAGWITPPVVELLGLDLADYARERVCQPIEGFRTGVLGGPLVETRYGRVVSYGIRRCEFDDYLLRRSGVRCRLGEALDSLDRIPDGWRINGDVEARIVVGAGGHFCPVARSIGVAKSSTAAVVRAQEIEFEADPADLERGTIDGRFPELFFCPDLKGYAWCFRKGNHLNVGLGRVEADGLGRHVAEFRDLLRSSGKVVAAIPERFHGHAYRLYEREPPPLVHDRLLLVGDSAGLAYPQSGEGIRPAVESGTLAAETIAQANGDYSTESLAPYAERCRQRFGPPRPRSATDWLPSGWLRFVAGRLLRSPWFSKRVVLDRWFLHADAPPLEVAAP